MNRGSSYPSEQLFFRPTTVHLGSIRVCDRCTPAIRSGVLAEERGGRWRAAPVIQETTNSYASPSPDSDTGRAVSLRLGAVLHPLSAVRVDPTSSDATRGVLGNPGVDGTYARLALVCELLPGGWPVPRWGGPQPHHYVAGIGPGPVVSFASSRILRISVTETHSPTPFSHPIRFG